MRALCWNGVNDLAVETVPDPVLVNPHDVIVRVRLSTTCGSDLHFIDGYLPGMRAGDVIGHEFMGEVVETGPEVTSAKAGDRVVVPSFIGCGACWYCGNGLYSACDTTNPNAALQQPLLGYPPAESMATPILSAATRVRTRSTSGCRSAMSIASPSPMASPMSRHCSVPTRCRRA